MEELKQQILQLCNDAELPLEAVFYILKDIYRDACDTYDAYLLQKQKEKNQKEEDKEETSNE